MNVMRMKNIEVEPLVEFIMKFELKGKESRMRTRFARLLSERIQMVNEEHQQLLKNYSNLDEDGNVIVLEREGKSFYDVVDKQKFSREYFLLMNEDYVIDLNEERKEMLILVKELILDCEMTFKYEEALQYDRWCEIVEQIEYDTEG